jgi:hypothetical protein
LLGIILISFSAFAPSSTASTNINLNDDSYDLLLRLEAEGLIQSGLLTTRPISRKEALRLILEAEENAEHKSLFIRHLIESLKERYRDEMHEVNYIKPLHDMYGQYVYTDSSHSEKFTYNNDGDPYEKGSNGFSSIAELGMFSFYLNPELRYSDDDTDLIMNRLYGILNFAGLELELGKDSQWWGPGYHGAILFSNNPAPITMLKLTNAHPVILPSVFKYLGFFKFVVFASKLEKERVIPNPYLWGMRINIKPHPYLELGLQRTALLGGEGRDEDISIWWKSLISEEENAPAIRQDEPGDQKAGLDVKLTLPFDWQPLQLYAEAAAEDEAPSELAYLAGIYVPRILNLERLDFRAEFANTYVKQHPKVWYNHGIYRSGYTYKGRVIGHHIGTDSRDIFLMARYFLPKTDNGWIAVSYDREKHNFSGNTKEITDELAININVPVNKALTLKTNYRYGRIQNLESIEGSDKNIHIFITEITYNF